MRLEVDPFDQDPMSALCALGEVDAFRSPNTSFPGSIYTTVQRDSELTGGWVADTGDDLVTWFDQWCTTQRGCAPSTSFARHADQRRTRSSCSQPSRQRRSSPVTFSPETTAHYPRVPLECQTGSPTPGS